MIAAAPFQMPWWMWLAIFAVALFIGMVIPVHRRPRS